jgi:8-oxo-dGTP pyrophosphatase MutT (NUDIX family)
MELQPYLARHRSFGGWREAWDGVPLEFRACLADELPPHSFVASVRGVVLRGDDVVMQTASRILSFGGRGEPGETIEQTLIREVGEETGWLVEPIGVIGFIHARHLDAQRPKWGRPAPDFVDPLFAVAAVRYEPARKLPGEAACDLVALAEIQRLGLDPINMTYLHEALRKRTHQTEALTSTSSAPRRSPP